MKFKRQSVSFFFFFFNFRCGRWPFDRVKEFTMFSSTRRFRGMLRAIIILVAYRSPYDEDTSVTDCHVPSTLSLSDDIKILRHILLIISITFLLRI